MINNKWLYDLPRIGPYLREFKYRKIFDLKLGEVAIDFGANIGGITRKMMKPGVVVYAFEPDPQAFKKLQDRFTGVENVICLNKAVSDYNGYARIYFHERYKEDPVKYSTGSSLVASKGNVDKNHFVECEVVDAGEFIGGLDKKIGLLKIDIEGEEVKVLNRLIDLGLTEKIRNIVVETHERIPVLKEPTEKLKRKIRQAGIKNIDLSWS